MNEFGHFYLVKLINPLVNEDQLLQTMKCFTNSETTYLSSEIQFHPTIHLLVELTNQHGNQLKLNYLIYNIIDNFMIFNL